MPESVKKDSDIHINFAKSADFIFAEIEVQWSSSIREHIKHYQQFSFLAAAIIVDPLIYGKYCVYFVYFGKC